jgi:hypothetical protein
MAGYIEDAAKGVCERPGTKHPEYDNLQDDGPELHPRGVL